MYHLKPCVMSIHTVENAAYNLKNIWSRIKHINQGFLSPKDGRPYLVCYIESRHKEYSSNCSANSSEIEVRHISSGFMTVLCNIMRILPVVKLRWLFFASACYNGHSEMTSPIKFDASGWLGKLCMLTFHNTVTKGIVLVLIWCIVHCSNTNNKAGIDIWMAQNHQFTKMDHLVKVTYCIVKYRSECISFATEIVMDHLLP